MDLSDEIDIAASAEVVFARVADLATMGRRSPENTGGEWLDGASGPALGARFRGTNARDGATWATIAEVVAYEPPRRFHFVVTYEDEPVSRWEFDLEPTEEGCRVSERWRDDRGPEMRADDGDFDRAAFTVASIRATLEGLRAECEA